MPATPTYKRQSRSLGILLESGYTERYQSDELDESEETILDSTGMFHWCKPRPLEQAILSRKAVSALNLQNHVIVGVFGNANSTLTGLRNFVMPLRASNLSYEELKYIVFVGSVEYMKREWQFIHNFPKLRVLPGSVLSSADLRAVNVDSCSMCAILSSHSSKAGNPSLEDAECILATLNIRSMQAKSRSLQEDPHSRQSVQLNPSQSSSHRIPVITELKHAYNMHFLDLRGAQHKVTKMKLYRTQLFATGSVFSGSFLDSLMSTGLPFGKVFLKALGSFGILCFGLYRLLEEPNPFANRFVITKPPNDFKLLSTDLLFAAIPFKGRRHIERAAVEVPSFACVEPASTWVALTPAKEVPTFTGESMSSA